MSVCTHWVGLLLSPESCLQPASSSVTHRRAGDCVGLICGCFQPASSSVTHRAAGPARPQSRFAASFAAAFNQSNPPSLTGQRITSGPLSESMLACTHCPPPSLRRWLAPTVLLRHLPGHGAGPLSQLVCSCLQVCSCPSHSPGRGTGPPSVSVLRPVCQSAPQAAPAPPTSHSLCHSPGRGAGPPAVSVCTHCVGPGLRLP